mmetsp:Transcript_28102/g.45211  ORF Transcript_28102/g.45211 Transcript_28102/m.45211 type:complete len:195 (+) Transcript_28102:127-711(+)
MRWLNLCIFWPCAQAAAVSVARSPFLSATGVSTTQDPMTLQGLNCRFMEPCQDGTQCGCYVNSCQGGIMRVGGEPFIWENPPYFAPGPGPSPTAPVPAPAPGPGLSPGPGPSPGPGGGVAPAPSPGPGGPSPAAALLAQRTSATVEQSVLAPGPMPGPVPSPGPAPYPGPLGNHLWGCKCCARYDSWFIGKTPV